MFLMIGAMSAGAAEIDSLLRVLDGVIANRQIYLTAREKQIETLKNERDAMRSDREVFQKNSEIISIYESFVCDSAKEYLRQNLAIGRRLRDREMIDETTIRLGLVYSMSGQFVQAQDLFGRVEYDSLPTWLKVYHGWAEIKYYENMVRSTDEPELQRMYQEAKLTHRDSVIGLLGVDTDMYRKEVASRYMDLGNYKAALPIYLDQFGKVARGTHDYAMMSMGMSTLYQMLGNAEQRKRHLLMAAITDTRLAVKENEALLSLAEMLYAEGDIDRAYRYMQAALDDANFYNSRFKNAQIARVYPVVEVSYLEKLSRQQKRMRYLTIGVSVLALLLGLVAIYCYKQTRVVSRSRAALTKANRRLERANQKLNEANIIKERYVGYFMHQCSLNVNRFDEFRKNVNRKIKANQIDDLYVLSSRPLEKELDELYSNFDKAFLNLYPNFIEEFNRLLKPENRFAETKDSLNITLRIFALMRLGITDMTHIANFLHYSVQTVYNYKSKVRKVSLLAPDEFEEKVKKIGTLAD